ncbi:hypothetical protein AgCh_006710 [Apium graveolens]
MFQFAKFEKSKERRLATELGYGFPIGDPWITDGISPWPFASESVLPSQCPGIHPMHSFPNMDLLDPSYNCVEFTAQKDISEKIKSSFANVPPFSGMNIPASGVVLRNADKAAIKAMLVNRVGDFGLAPGISGCFTLFQTVDFSTIFARASAPRNSLVLKASLGLRLPTKRRLELNGLSCNGRKKSFSATGTRSSIALQETGPNLQGFPKGTPGEDLFKHSNRACFPNILSSLPGVIQ